MLTHLSMVILCHTFENSLNVQEKAHLKKKSNLRIFSAHCGKLFENFKICNTEHSSKRQGILKMLLYLDTKASLCNEAV
jgi:hypothetical protein